MSMRGALAFCVLLFGWAGGLKSAERPSTAEASLVRSAADPVPPPSTERPASPAGEQTPARLSDFGFYLDAGGQASLEEMVELAHRQPAAFTAIPGYYNGGFSSGVRWLKFTVQAPPGEWWLVLLPPYLDDLRFYEPSARGWVEHRGGDQLPFGRREIAYRGFGFRLQADASAAGPRTCFLRLQTAGTNQLLPRLLSREEFHQSMLIEYVALLGLVGFLFLMAGINLVSYFPLRDRIHLLFVAALLIQAVLYLSMGGFTAQLFLPNHPAITDGAVRFMSLLGFSIYGLFYIEFLAIPPRKRVTYYAYRMLQWGGLLALPTVETALYPFAIQAVNFLFILCALLAVPHAVGLWRQAVPGRNQVAGVVIFNIGSLFVHVLGQVGVLPVNLLTLHAAQLSSFGTIALAHLALVARQNNLREERIRAERDAARERELRVQMEKFIDVVSHEYRNPLAVLETNLHLLAVPQGESQLGPRLQKMSAAVDRLAVVFNRTLRAGEWGSLRRMESAPLELEEFLRTWLGRPGTLWRDFAGGFRWQSAGPVYILGDRLLLETVLTNVLENACKYSLPGHAISLALSRDAICGYITVTNTIAPTTALDPVHLFERGVRGSNAQGIAGTGMGLYLVKKLVADQRGAVTLDLTRPGFFILALAFPLEKSARQA